MDANENRIFWQVEHNPAAYLNAPRARTDRLVEVVNSLKLDSPAILEIGCNAGRNLHGLWDAGYRDLTGLEINLAAIKLMRDARPDCVIAAIPHAVEDIIKKLPTKRWDVVFTMATLLHIHRDSDWIFPEIARISAHYVITIERENSNARNRVGIQRHWARRYKQIFESLGMKQIASEKSPGDLANYILRVFTK